MNRINLSGAIPASKVSNLFERNSESSIGPTNDIAIILEFCDVF